VIRGGNAVRVDVDAAHPTTRLLGQVQRRATRAAGDFQHAGIGAHIKQQCPRAVLVSRGPTVLPDVVAKRLATNTREHVRLEILVRAVVQIRFAGHWSLSLTGLNW